MSLRASAVLGVFVAIGLSVLGLVLKAAVVDFKSFERTVAVKGLAEMEVEADLVIWPLSFGHNDNNLDSLYAKIEADTNKVKAFLTENNISSEEIIESPLAITDRFASDYVDTSKVKFRYSIQKSLTVRSSDIHKILKVKKTVGSLIASGIVLQMDDYRNQTRFLYTKLNDIKPGMIKDATESARQAAEQFAKDSKSKLGKIKYANQGLFSIETLDQSVPYLNKVRVVTSVTYYLKD